MENKIKIVEDWGYEKITYIVEFDDEGELIYNYRLRDTKDGELTLQTIFVDIKHRNKGYATKIIKEVMKLDFTVLLIQVRKYFFLEDTIKKLGWIFDEKWNDIYHQYYYKKH